MNRRITVTAAVAVVLASTSLFSLIAGTAWLGAVIGAVTVAALAGSLARLAPLPATAGGMVLALLACAPLLSVRHWWAVAITAAVAGCAAGRAARQPLLRAPAVLLTPLAALLLFLNLSHASRLSVARIVPTVQSMHVLYQQAVSGLAERIYAPPVPGSHGVQLVAAAGVGLVAIAVDLVAVRLRRPALAGIGLLVVYLAPITTSASTAGGPGVIAFCLAGTGYLALLAADGRSRLRAFGHVVSVWQNSGAEQRADGPDTRALAAAGRRVGLVAVCLAIITPVLLPALHPRHPSHGQGGGTVISIGTAALPDPIVQMQRFLQEPKVRTVLTYQTSDPEPAQQYLQEYVLNYDPAKSTWILEPPRTSVAVGAGQLPPAPGFALTSPAVPSSTTIKFGDVLASAARETFLPAPYAAATLKIAGGWRVDPRTLMIYSGQAHVSGLSYEVTSSEADPSVDLRLLRGPQPPGIAALAGRQYTGFRSPVASQLLAIARSITRGKRGAFAQATALQDYLSAGGGFSYSTAAGLANKPRALVDFLTVTKRGDCQQFAFAMAALARLLGIPARIAVGFTGGSPVSGTGTRTWRVTTADAHAWPELYFAHFGWLRFEPTPGGSGGQATARAPSYAGGPTGHVTGPTGGTGPGTHLKGSRSHQEPAKIRGLFGIDGGALPHKAVSALAAPHHGGLPLAILVAAALLLLGLIAPGISRLIVRGRRWRAATGDAGLAQAAWLELRDELTDLGQHCLPSESPRAVARRVAEEAGLSGPAGEALERIARVVEQADYAPAPAPAGAIRADVAAVRRGLATSARRRQRLRAVLLPASTLGPARETAGRALAATLGWLETAGRRAPRTSAS